MAGGDTVENCKLQNCETSAERLIGREEWDERRRFSRERIAGCFRSLSKSAGKFRLPFSAARFHLASDNGSGGREILA